MESIEKILRMPYEDENVKNSIIRKDNKIYSIEIEEHMPQTNFNSNDYLNVDINRVVNSFSIIIQNLIHNNSEFNKLFIKKLTNEEYDVEKYNAYIKNAVLEFIDSFGEITYINEDEYRNRNKAYNYICNLIFVVTMERINSKDYLYGQKLSNYYSKIMNYYNEYSYSKNIPNCTPKQLLELLLFDTINYIEMATSKEYNNKIIKK